MSVFTFTVLGLKRSGKTHLVKNEILPAFLPYLYVIDPNAEYGPDLQGKGGFPRYVPSFAHDYERYKAEIAIIINNQVIPACDKVEEQAKRGYPDKRRLRLLLVEEADLLLPSRMNMSPELRYLLVNSGHFDLNLGFISRRPTDLSTYVMDNSDFIIVFKQAGENALKRIKGMKEGADVAVSGLNFDKHEYLFFDRDRTYSTPDGQEIRDIFRRQVPDLKLR